MDEVKFVKPEENEICVCVLGGGNGYGESIVMHLGYNNWIIIDSAKNPTTKEILSLKYLSDLEVSIDSSVKLVLATHWHGDHIRGLSEVVEKCSNAIFSCSQALGNKNFMYLIGLDNQNTIKSSSTREFSKILEHHRESSKPIYRAVQDRIIFSTIFEDKTNASVASLSPSDQAIQEFEELFKKEIESYKNANTKISNKSPNHSSVVLKISIGTDEILLGADLENTKNPNTGWTAVLKSNLLPKNASVFKIPHHGSNNAYNSDVWDNALSPENPIACLTPYNRGKKSLPSKKDIRNIYAHTSKAFITSNPDTLKEKKRASSEKKIIKSLGYTITEIPFDYGAIELRKKINAATPWKINLIGKAVELNYLID